MRGKMGPFVVPAVFVAVVGLAPAAHATLVGFSNVTGANQAVVVSGSDIPNPVTENPNDGRLVGWNERQNVTLSADLRVDRVFDPNASFVSSAGGGDFFIKAGTVVSSHYLQWDPFGDNASGSVQATIELDSQAFAFITADQNLFDSDGAVALPGIDYNDFNLRGLESGDTTDFNGPDVDIDWFASSPGDWTRLITAFSPGAAPELTTGNDAENASSLDFGRVRIGDSQSASVEVGNTGGDQPSGLSGTVPAPGVGGEFTLDESASFGPLGPSGSTTRQYSFSPADRGAETLSVGEIDTNDPDGVADADAPLTLSGIGVGPEADFDVGDQDMPIADGGAIDFFADTLVDPVTVALTIANVSADDDGGDSSLTDLTLVDVVINGVDASHFTLLNFAPGQVVPMGGSFDLQIEFDPANVEGLFDASLVVTTDQNAPLGDEGDQFQFDLSAESIPEPSSAALLALAGLAALGRRCRRG